MQITDSQVILASGSPYRRILLERLLSEFGTCTPGVDEAPLADESPGETALRLSLSKAAQVSSEAPEAIVIAGDQVAELHGQLLGKPGNKERAHQQLRACSGHTVVFHSAAVVQQQSKEFLRQHTDITRVRFRSLSPEIIDHYLDREAALDCAGSFKSEGLGIMLTAAITTEDPTALIGLPLIWLSRALQDAGVELGRATP